MDKISIDTAKHTITVGDTTYHIEHDRDRGGSGEETLTVKDFSVEDDDWIFPFLGLSAELGYEQEISPHDDPREWSNVGTMAVKYDRYNLGDEDISQIDFGELDPVSYFKQERKARVVIPLTVYEHSGITMRAGNVTLPYDPERWDTSFVGFIFDTPEGVKECIGDNATDFEIESALRCEVEVYADYLEGDITWWSVTDEETDYHESCGGYVGDHKECEREAYMSLGWAIAKRLMEDTERAYWSARDVETK